MRNIFYTVAIMAGLLFGVSSVQAADSVATAVQKRYATISGMQAEFTQVLEHQESGDKEKRIGTLHFLKPLSFRWETKDPIPELLLVTPEAIWNAFPDEDMAYKYSSEISQEMDSLVRLVTGQSNLEKDFYIENKGTKGGLATLILDARNPTVTMTTVELVVEAKTGTIKQVTIIDFYNNRNAITFTSQLLDPKLDASVFTFIPPKGMKVEERAKDGAFSKPLMQW